MDLQPYTLLDSLKDNSGPNHFISRHVDTGPSEVRSVVTLTTPRSDFLNKVRDVFFFCFVFGRTNCHLHFQGCQGETDLLFLPTHSLGGHFGFSSSLWFLAQSVSRCRDCHTQTPPSWRREKTHRQCVWTDRSQCCFSVASWWMTSSLWTRFWGSAKEKKKEKKTIKELNDVYCIFVFSMCK